MALKHLDISSSAAGSKGRPYYSSYSDVSVAMRELAFGNNLAIIDLSHVPELEHLSVANCYRLGGLDISSCSRLRHLDISGLELIPAEAGQGSGERSPPGLLSGLAGCTSLEALLWDSGPMHALDLQQHTSLLSLNVANSPRLHTLHLPLSLHSLNCSGCCEIRGLNVGSSQLPNLTTLDARDMAGLSDVNFSTQLKHLTLGAPSIEHLDLTEAAQLESVTINHGDMQQSASLRTLLLPKTAVLRHVSVHNSRQLQHLDVSSLPKLASLSVVQVAVRHLDISSAGGIRELCVKGTLATPLSLQHCTSLETLEISNEVSQGAMVDMSRCTNLKSITVEYRPGNTATVMLSK